MDIKVTKIAIMLALASASAYAQISNIENALTDLCIFVYRLVPVIALLMLVCAGVVYAAGQIFGAETRSRTNVWATAMLTGSVIGILIITLAPYVLSQMYGAQGNFSWDTCNFD